MRGAFNSFKLIHSTNMAAIPSCPLMLISPWMVSLEFSERDPDSLNQTLVKKEPPSNSCVCSGLLMFSPKTDFI